MSKGFMPTVASNPLDRYKGFRALSSSFSGFILALR
jgi:hypothetical protein